MILSFPAVSEARSGFAAEILREFGEADADPDSWFVTPMFLEIVARKSRRLKG